MLQVPGLTAGGVIDVGWRNEQNGTSYHEGCSPDGRCAYRPLYFIRKISKTPDSDDSEATRFRFRSNDGRAGGGAVKVVLSERPYTHSMTDPGVHVDSHRGCIPVDNSNFSGRKCCASYVMASTHVSHFQLPNH